MSNLLRYCGACVKQVIYSVNYFVAWIEFYPDFDRADGVIKPKGFRDFMDGAFLCIEYTEKNSLLIKKIDCYVFGLLLSLH